MTVRHFRFSGSRIAFRLESVSTNKMEDAMVRVPDPANDFDGCLDALVKNAFAEIEGMTPEQQDDHFPCRAVEHAITMHQLDTPQF